MKDVKLKRVGPVQGSAINWEHDGWVDFCWLPAQTNLGGCDDTFSTVEIRIGFPISNPLKILDIEIRYESGEVQRDKFRVHKGWSSLFVELAFKAPVQIICLYINEPLQVPNDSRYLGVMFSYAFYHSRHPFKSASLNAREAIDQAVCKFTEIGNRTDWSNWMTKNIEQNAEAFYSDRALEPVAALRAFTPLNKLNAGLKREVWVEKHAAQNARILDVGCGKGTLGHLNRSDLFIAGVDYSEANILQAKENGYHDVRKQEGSRLPYPDSTFDIVTSLDVMGHVTVEKKDAFIAEQWRVLKPGGLALNAIETDEFNVNEMHPEDYARMILMDGHIGIEPRSKSIQRFSKFFEILDCRLIGNVCMSHFHWLRAHYLYGANLPAELVYYLLGMNEQEQQAFDVAVGWTFWALMNEKYDSKSSGGMLLLSARKLVEETSNG